MRQCYKCGESKPLTVEFFASNSRRPDGWQSQCKECQKAYRKQHYEANKEKYVGKAADWRNQERLRFYQWLQSQCCKDCGENDFRLLQCDHVGDKAFSISHKIGMVKLEVLLEEIAKCDVVCANCHIIRTCERGNFHSYLTIQAVVT